MEDIDVVISWVDGNDAEWLKLKNEYAPKKAGEGDGASLTRYRDWDNLQYIFRGIEKYMPWARRVYLITWGHLPEWINTDCERLRIVKHDEFIPKEYLPTFNSNAIELNMHRIEGIAEKIIYFNDDMFVIQGTCPEDFFCKDGVRDMACLSPQPIYKSTIMNIELNNMKIINDRFSVNDIKACKRKWIKPLLYGQYALRTALFLRFSSIIGIFQPHVPYTFFRSTFETVWNTEYEALDSTCRNRFRSTDDVNIWLMRSWQLMSGKFKPRTYKFGRLIPASETDTVMNILKNPGRCRLVCINDDASVVDFAGCKESVNGALLRLFPDKSSFEL